MADIQRRFFKRFPVDLPLDKEPTTEILASVTIMKLSLDKYYPKRSAER